MDGFIRCPIFFGMPSPFRSYHQRLGFVSKNANCHEVSLVRRIIQDKEPAG